MMQAARSEGIFQLCRRLRFHTPGNELMPYLFPPCGIIKQTIRQIQAFSVFLVLPMYCALG